MLGKLRTRTATQQGLLASYGSTFETSISCFLFVSVLSKFSFTLNLTILLIRSKGIDLSI